MVRTKKTRKWDEGPRRKVKRMETLMTEGLFKIKPTDPLRLVNQSRVSVDETKPFQLIRLIRDFSDENNSPTVGRSVDTVMIQVVRSTHNERHEDDGIWTNSHGRIQLSISVHPNFVV